MTRPDSTPTTSAYSTTSMAEMPSKRSTAADATTRAAAPGRRMRAQAAFEGRTLLANGEQLLVSLLLPAMALLGLHFASTPDLGPGRRIDLATPGVLALAVVSTAFTGQAIATGFDRRYGVLRLLGVTPLGSRGLLVAKAVAVAGVVAVQTLVLGGLGLVLGWHPHWAGVPLAIVILLLGCWVFVALALVVAGRIRAEGVLVVANLLWVLLAVGGGLLLATTQYPSWWEPIARFLPTGALGDGLRSALTGSGALALPLVVLVIWGAVLTFAASRLFRWSD